VTYNELTRRLKRLGVRFEREARGSHEIWRNPSNGQVTLIANHGSSELRGGVVSKILKDLGFTEDDLRRA
jgi:predicted RNA binding protein YcfA (HicA-like mRNA interferase family)